MDNKKFFVRNTEFSDIDEILEISDSRLGKGYVSRETLENIVNKKETRRSICAIDVSTNKVAGFAVFDVYTYDKVKDIARGEVEILKDNDEIGYIKTAAVSKDYKGYGIGTLVIKTAMDILEEEGIKNFFSSAWKPNGKINVEHVLNALGFKIVREIENYWYQESIDLNYLCPACGNPCRCSCVIFAK